MLTLERIRQTQEAKIKRERELKNNYKSPSGFTIVSKFLKSKNIEILNTFSKENCLSEASQKHLNTKYHKLNYYTPCVVVKIADEEAQLKQTHKN